MTVTIDQAHAAVDKLTKSHRDIEELLEGLSRERNEIAAAAISDDDAQAKQRLKDLNRQTGAAQIELENLTAALVGENKRLKEAQDREHLAGERERAAAVTELAKLLEERAAEIDDVLEQLVTLSNRRALLPFRKW
jgi:acyl transferase domain-containing protein